MIRARKSVGPIALAILIGCGGNSSVSNAAHLRFFDALNGTGNVRLYVGGRLYQSGGNASIENGSDPKYGDVPSGTVSLILNNYNDQNTGSNTSTLASLTSQTLLEGRNYTAVALLVGTTKKLVLLTDNSNLSDQSAYFRIVNANNTTTPLYIEVDDKTSGSTIYSTDSSTGLASGGNSGLQVNYAGSAMASGGEDVIIHVYTDTDLTNEIATKTVSLTLGKAVTTFIYNRSSGSGISFIDSTDQDTNVTVTPTTTTTSGTTSTDTAGTTSTATAGTTATSGTTSSSGTTASAGTTATAGTTAI